MKVFLKLFTSITSLQNIQMKSRSDLPASHRRNSNSINYAHNQLEGEDKEEHHEIEGTVTPATVQENLTAVTHTYVYQTRLLYKTSKVKYCMRLCIMIT